MLTLIDPHGTAQALERRHRLLEACQAGGSFEVKVIRRVGRLDLSRQGRLATLAWTDQRDYSAAPQCLADLTQKLRPLDHACNSIMIFLQKMVEFHDLRRWKTDPSARAVQRSDYSEPIDIRLQLKR